jgi:hypothetical protein
MKPNRDWTQEDIISETILRKESVDSERPFFHILGDVDEMAFGRDGYDSCDELWQFPMGNLTIGQLQDFFAIHKTVPKLSAML